VYYLVDVSLQGAKINPVIGAGRYGGEPFPTDKGHLVDPSRMVIDPQPFRGCRRSCSGVNFYCDNNWRRDRYK
jgi:hypothetical protein